MGGSKRRDRKSNGDHAMPQMFSEISMDDDDHSTNSNSVRQESVGGKRAQKAHPKLFAAKETKQISWLKGITLISFLIITAAVSTVMYYSTTRDEERNFDDIFEEHTRKIGESFISNLQRSVVALDNFAVTLSSNGELNWPFVVVDDFEIRAASTRLLARASLLALVPKVTESQRVGWHTFSNTFANDWIEAGLEEQTRDINYVELDYRQQEQDQTRKLQGSSATASLGEPVELSSDRIATSIFRWEGQEAVVDEGRSDYFPMWQSTPVELDLVNFNLLSHYMFGNEARLAAESGQIVLGNIMITPSNNSSITETVVDPFEGNRKTDGEPISQILVPVVDTLILDDSANIVALLQASVHWTDFLEGGELPSAASGIVCKIANDCDQEFFYQLNVGDDKSEFSFIGDESKSKSILWEFEHIYEVGALFDEGQVTFSGRTVNRDYCPYRLHVFPTQEVQDNYITWKPILYTSLFVIVFVFTSLVFLVYDCLVERRNRLVMTTAVKSHEIVSNLFPENVRGRLFGEGGKKESTASDGMSPQGIADMMDSTGRVRDGSRPIADLFPATTVLFADIAGFTAWSSVRDPAQVFILLETIYAAFDKIATKRRVFKVETIGDCYVAVTGLPSPQPDHAVIMVKFARECLRKMTNLTRSLEVELGPDTGDLCLRIGIHSGPVTAGVLRGQKSRFQLFGDTVNTASRMESNGRPTMIQCSAQTAENLKDANKGHWVIPRKEMVHAKGKGLVQTYWVVDSGPSKAEGGSTSRMSETESDHSENDDDDIIEEEKAEVPTTPSPKRAWSDLPPHMQRLIHWNVDMLGKLLKNVVAARMGGEASDSHRQSRIMNISINLGLKQRISDQSTSLSAGSRDSEPPNGMLVMNNPREEYSEAISLPRFDPKILTQDVNPNDIQLDEVVARQLEDYVTTVACAYHENPFHNFEHASHVTMSANKILKRVVAAGDLSVRKSSIDMYASKLHDFTYGITSDALTHFACVFSAMIHDVDHPGVPNMQLVKEKDEMAEMYDNKSVAEQNSFDFSWELLMDPSYEELRKCIFSNDEELKRFRQLVVNSLMATDVFDPELVKLRNSRWEKAFAEESKEEEHPMDRTDLKATIVIEHIIQAADVAHTMQHWHVYQKWNRRLFEEMYSAYKSGRGKDPSEGWYKGELWFFDNYIIPLAKKLKDCGVFGASSDEFLTYAMDNRSEWQAKGESIVEDMVACSTNKSDELSMLRD